MYNEGFEVTRVDYLENKVDGASSRKRVGIFVSEEGKTAHAKVDEFIKGKRITLYLGWDNKIYPRYEVEPITLK